jgi:hypothetical protein
MKTSLSLILSLFIYNSANANIGWTLQECRKNYGKEVKAEPAWCGGTGYSFIKDDMYVYAIITDKEVVDVSYFNNLVAEPLDWKVCEKLWLLNQKPGPAWDAGSPNWNWRKTFKKLGFEKGEHIVQFSRDSKRAHVGNRSKNGYQVRTLKQFYNGQKAIRKLLSK